MFAGSWWLYACVVVVWFVYDWESFREPEVYCLSHHPIHSIGNNANSPHAMLDLCGCVCVCVSKKERGRETDYVGYSSIKPKCNLSKYLWNLGKFYFRFLFFAVMCRPKLCAWNINWRLNHDCFLLKAIYTFVVKAVAKGSHNATVSPMCS